jgi:prepilin-type N-terminal cleavage/methylation domain-containing protein
VSASTKSTKQSGFTIVELTIAITVITILMASLIAFMFNSFALISRNGALAEMSTDSQNLLRQTVEALRYGAGVRQSNSITDDNQPSGWTTSNSNFVIVISVPAQDNTREYIIDSDTGEPYLNELVYYKDGDTLRQRTLAHPSASGNSLTTTCPDATASPTCPADKTLIEHLDDMVFTLYDQDNNSTNNPLLARSVKIDLDMKRTTLGEDLTFTNSIRVTLRNNFI